MFATRVAFVRSRKSQVPVLCNLEFAVSKNPIVPGRQLHNPAKHRARIWDPQKRQILVQRLRVKFGFNPRYLQQSFNLRSKRKTIAAVEVIERLDAKVIAGNEYRRYSLPQIAHGERKHSIEALDAVRAFLFVKTKDHLGVGMRNKPVSLAFEFGPQL